MVSTKVKLYKRRKLLRKQFDKGKISANKFREQNKILTQQLENENIKSQQKLEQAQEEGKAPVYRTITVGPETLEQRAERLGIKGTPLELRKQIGVMKENIVPPRKQPIIKEKKETVMKKSFVPVKQTQEQRVKTLLQREKRLQEFKDIVTDVRFPISSDIDTGKTTYFEPFKINKNERYSVGSVVLGPFDPSGKFQKGVARDIARKPIDIGFGVPFIGGRVALFGESLTSKEGREFLYEERKKVPKALAEAYNPTKPGGLVNLGLTAVSISGVQKFAQEKFYPRSDLEFELYPRENKITGVGKGTFRGKKAEASFVSKDDLTKLVIKRGKETIRIEQKPDFTTTKVFKGGILRKTKVTKTTNPLIDPKIKQTLISEKIPVQVRGAKTLGNAERIFRTDIKAEGLNLRTSDIIRTRVEATPQVVRVVQTKGGVPELKVLDIRQPSFEFGKASELKDILQIEKIKGGTKVTQVAQPRITQIGTQTRTGFGTYRLTETPKYPFKPIIGKKAQISITTDLIEKPVIGITPKTPTTFNYGNLPTLSSIPTTSTFSSSLFGVGLGFQSKQNTFNIVDSRLTTKSLTDVNISGGTSIRQVTKPSQDISSIIISKPKQDIRQLPKQTQIPQQKQDIITGPGGPIGPSPQQFDIPKVPTIPDVPFVFNLKGFKEQTQKKRKSKKDRLDQLFRFTPSLTGQVFGVKARPSKKTFTGFEIR